ncbi:MFS transporter [Streptomyces sp. WAC06614]|uniref:MFS transporter n=1 Tax=Streptomyces sp. WAC06614 TaxID=2487416 RepID=UPI000F7906A8|nr:MFS transporter [Streptomyces sp. WAC06614]RSS84235.1 MFS transporter [Streptomyces sp. WAC06614]
MPPLVRRLLAGRSCAALASALIPTTLTLAVVRTGSATDLGLVLACELLPLLLLLPVAGVVADRFPARRVVLAADLVRAAAQLATGVLLLTGPVRVAELAALAAVTGAAVAFGTASARTLVVSVVPAADLLKVNARLGVAQGIAQFAGPAAAGALMLGLGAGWSSVLTAGLFVASAFTLGGLSPRTAADRPGARPDERPAARPGFLAELRAGWAETRRHPWFLANVAAHGVWHLAAGFLLTLGPLIAVESLGGERSWVVVAQTGTAGLLAGVWAAGRLPLRRPLLGVALGAAALALPLTAFALRLPLAVTAGAYFCAMFGLGVLSPLWETALQRRVPVEALGRVGAFDTLISFAARPLGLAVAAPLAAATGTAAPLLAGAVLTAVANLAVLLLPDVRAYARTDPERTHAPALR